MRLPSRTFASFLAFVLAACGDSTGPAPVASVVISVPSGTIGVGSSVQLTAELKDAQGNELSGRAVTWNSSNLSVATISPDGMLFAIATGSTTITATSEGKAATRQLTISPPPVATVTVNAPEITMIQGATQALQVTLRGANNAVLSGRSISFSSSASSIASVNQNGVVSAVSVGEAIISATSEGKVGSVAITVLSSPTISAVSTGVLQYGAQATLQGQGFAVDAFSNVVRVNGVQATVNSATSTEITFVVPCVPTGMSSITVTRSGVESEAIAVQSVAPQLSLAPGESQVFAAATSVCNELPATESEARYLLTVFSVSTVPTLQVPVQVQGLSPTVGNVQQVLFASRDLPPVQESLLEQQVRQYERAHIQHLERERQLYREMVASGLVTRTRNAPARFTVQAVPQVGQSRNFAITYGLSCANTSRIAQTKAIYVGTRGIIWEDQNNPILAANDAALASYYERIGQMFDMEQYESVKNNFGDPLLRDAQLINEGRVHMVFTVHVNNHTNAAAYVTSCDQVSKDVAAGSNFGPTFYAQVPTLTGANVNDTRNPSGWFAFMARTVVHETKHIASLSTRTANGSPDFEEGWLEEGSARMAEEMWVRESLHKVDWKANTGFGSASDNGLYCDFHLTDATCNALDVLRRPSWGLRRHLNEIRAKLFDPSVYSPFGGDGGVAYNTVWSLVRYAIDRFGTSDADFLRALVSSNLTGMENLLAVTGATREQLLGGWGMALFADDYPGMPKTDITQFQTWNLRSIYSGLHQSPSWSNTYNTPFPITPTQLTAGRFTTETVNIVGGGHAFFELTTSLPQTIHIKAPGTGLLHPDVRLAIVRLQ